MVTGISKKNVASVIEELILDGYKNINIKYQYDDMYIITYD